VAQHAGLRPGGAKRVPQNGRLAAHRVSGQGRINRLIVKRLDGEFSTAWD
jgi:hypothetical protein